MAQWVDEILRLLKSAPHPQLGIQSIAERVGISEHDVREILADLEREGRIQRDPVNERWIVVEPAASAAPPDEPIP
jgi:DNA-binding IclR family transcriptional regulator